MPGICMSMREMNFSHWKLPEVSFRNRSVNLQVMLAMGLGNPPAVGIWTIIPGSFGSRPVQKPDTQPVRGPNMDP